MIVTHYRNKGVDSMSTTGKSEAGLVKATEGSTARTTDAQLNPLTGVAQ